MKNKEVYIVHAVDTEGPLYESKIATFKRAEELFNIKFKKKDTLNLSKLKKGLGLKKSLREKVKQAFNSHLVNYNSNWSMINHMLERISKQKFRNKLLDSKKNGYLLTWHCVDHINYKHNPRRRTQGYGKIFNHYCKYIKRKKLRDQVQFHFHPMSTYQEAHRNSSFFFRNDNIFQILCRRIIDNKWFPVANRAGFHIERPDSHYFLEQYIPFDLSNTNKNEKNSSDPSENARGWDWRTAPNNWEIYNPSHDDYRVKGNCRRYIGRILSINNRTESIDLKEVEKAFKRANTGKKTLLAITSHDFRDIESEINLFRELIKKCTVKFPKVKFFFVDTVTGFQKVLNLNPKTNKLKLSIKKIRKNKFKIKAEKGAVFGPQPFLAIKFQNGKYFHDNLDFGLKKGEWFYTLGDDTVRPKDVSIIAVGAADNKGNFDTASLKI